MKKLLMNSMACAMAIGSATVANELAAQEAEVPAVQTAAADAMQQPDAMMVWEDGFNATRAMQEARVAIFDGDPDTCKQMLNQAYQSLELVSKDETTAKTKTDLIPINGTLKLADTFVPNPQAAAHITKANQHFQRGESAMGIEQLRLGEIEVSFSRILMPLEATKKRLADAMELAEEEKFYEANLALKSAEEGLQFDQIKLFESPKAPATSANG